MGSIIGPTASSDALRSRLARRTPQNQGPREPMTSSLRDGGVLVPLPRLTKGDEVAGISMKQKRRNTKCGPFHSDTESDESDRGTGLAVTATAAERDAAEMAAVRSRDMILGAGEDPVQPILNGTSPFPHLQFPVNLFVCSCPSWRGRRSLTLVWI